KTSDKRIFIIQKEIIIGYLTEHATAKTSEIADALNISAPRARAVLSRLLSEDIIIGEGANRNRTYRLKS
ncbi:MAG: winged helix-turn-helix transcriptional regulator, partial [Oscillospiraceae bacterium]|nr:winged helix-turn-helix transcriptional regulator [Oscillospiraceae bacterium]